MTRLETLYVFFQKVPLGDAMMIAATAPLFTIFYARMFLKETISVLDLMNLALVFGGVIFIVKPPFLFGSLVGYNKDSTSLYAMIGLLVGSLLLMAPIYVILRKLKGKFFKYFSYNLLKSLRSRGLHNLAFQ